MEPLTIFLRYAGQQTEFVLFLRLSAASSLELALAAMSVQSEVGWRIAGQEPSDVFDPFAYFTGQGERIHLQRGMVVAMHDLAQGYLAANNFGQQKRIERKQQLVFLCNFVDELETIGDQLGMPTSALGGQSFYSA